MVKDQLEHQEEIDKKGHLNMDADITTATDVYIALNTSRDDHAPGQKNRSDKSTRNNFTYNK